MSGDGKCEVCGVPRVVIFTTADCPNDCDKMTPEQVASFKAFIASTNRSTHDRCIDCKRIVARGKRCKCGRYCYP